MLGFKSFRSARATFGRNRALAYAEEGPKQEFSAGLAAILCTGHCEIVASDETSSSGFPSVRDRTDLAVVQIKVESVWPAECYLSITVLVVDFGQYVFYFCTGAAPWHCCWLVAKKRMT